MEVARVGNSRPAEEGGGPQRRRNSSVSVPLGHPSDLRRLSPERGQ